MFRMPYAGRRSRLAAAGVLALGLALALVVAGSGGARPAAKKKVYFIFTGFAYPYFQPMAQGVKAAAKHYPDLDIKIVNANNSVSDEITDINVAIAGGAKGIILNTIQESATSAAKHAMSQNVPVVTIDRDVNDTSARIAFIGDNDVTLGKEQTQQALSALAKAHMKKPWHVVVLQGTLGSSTAIGRLNGAMSVLKPYVKKGAAKIVLNQSADFATDKAQSTISELLAKTSNVQLIICGNDAMALGAITAVKDHGLKPGKAVFISGADAQPESLSAVKAGTQLNTVTHSPYLEAFWSVEAMDNYLAGKTKPPAKFKKGNVIIPMTVVTKANVGKVSAWGTPQTIPPLPYGKAKPYPAR